MFPAFAASSALPVPATRSLSHQHTHTRPCVLSAQRPTNPRRPRAPLPKRARPAPTTVDVSLSSSERIQKIMSRLGVASRRRSEELILEGRVSLNGRVVRTLGVTADSQTDKIRVDGNLVELPHRPIWLALHKPRSFLSDPNGALARFLPRGFAAQLVAAGRVPEAAAGLLILTNERGAVPPLAHASCPHVSTWVVDVEGSVTAHHLRSLNAGIIPSDDPQSATAVPVIASVVASGRHENRLLTKLELRVRSGQNRVIHKLCEAAGLKVDTLTRTGFGPIDLGSLKKGESRPLKEKEIKALKRGVSAKTIQAWSVKDPV